MDESESEAVPKSSARPEDGCQPGSSAQATLQLNEERNITQPEPEPEPEPVPSTSGIRSKGKMPVYPRSRACKKKREDLEDSIISAFRVIKISGEGNEDDSSDDDYGEGEGDDEEEEEAVEVEVEVEVEENKGKKSNDLDYKQDESALLEMSIDPRDTYPQVCEPDDDFQPSTSFSSLLETATIECEQQPVSEENPVEQDASAPAQTSPPPQDSKITPLSKSVMSELPFQNLELPKEMIRHLKTMGITLATILQEKAIPILMQDKDAFMHAGSGSGKTVAYAITVIHYLLLIKPRVTREDGIRVLVVVPTKECAKKTYETLSAMVRPAPWLEVGRLGGGDHFRLEKETVKRGSVILVTTPMRFLDHLRRSSNIFLKNLFCLVVDGLDEIIERGDEKHLLNIMTVLDKGPDFLHHPEHLSFCKKEHVEAPRQTILVSSSIMHEVAYFTGLYTTNPMMIDDRPDSPPKPLSLPDDNSIEAKRRKKPPPPLYNQYFMIVPERMKLVALVGFVMWKLKVANERRILIFAGTQTIADYFAELFFMAYGKKDPECIEEKPNQLSGLDVYHINPFMSEKDKLDLFAVFCRSNCGILFCSDTAVKGMDLPRVDWVIHLHAPTCTSDYMARIGMAGPGFQIGSSLVLLLPAEKGYARELEDHDVPMRSMKLKQSFRNLWAFYPHTRTIDDMILEIQTKLEDLVHRTPWIRDGACRAFASWCRLYSSYPQNLRHIFRFTFVHMDNYVHSFALREQSAFAIGQAKKLHSEARRKAAKRSAPADDEESPQETSAKLPTLASVPLVLQAPDVSLVLQAPDVPLALPAPPSLQAPEASQAGAPVPAPTEEGQVMQAPAEPPADPCTSDQTGSKKRKNYDEMELSDDEEGRPEKRPK